jgi:phage tail protein X
MAIENVQQLLTEQLGKNNATEIFTTAAQTSKDWYCVYFPTESVVASITVANATGDAALQTTLPAGTTLFMNITAITLTSGIGIGFQEDPS